MYILNKVKLSKLGIGCAHYSLPGTELGPQRLHAAALTIWPQLCGKRDYATTSCS